MFSVSDDFALYRALFNTKSSLHQPLFNFGFGAIVPLVYGVGGGGRTPEIVKKG